VFAPESSNVKREIERKFFQVPIYRQVPTRLQHAER